VQHSWHSKPNTAGMCNTEQPASKGYGQASAAPLAPQPQEEEDEDVDDEEDEDEDEEEDVQELVGYLEDPPSDAERMLLTRHFFPSKVGGRPAWLIPENLPETACKRCGAHLRFLMQVNASQGSRKETCFHRTIHLLVCTNCQPNEVRAFRAQLPRKNDYYSAEKPDREAIVESPADPELEALCCPHCGLPWSDAPQLCSDCARRKRNGDSLVCFTELEVSVDEAEGFEDEADAEADEDIPTDATAQETEAEKQGDDPDAYAAMVKASVDAVNSIEVDEKKLSDKDKEAIAKLREYQKMVRENPDAAMDKFGARFYEEWCEEHSVKDALFNRFQRFNRENLQHVLRYELGGSPMWFSRLRKMRGSPPNCQHCGGKRVFEFQVQPALIALLKGSPLQDRLDYGTVCVFSCEESCDADQSSPYLEEFVYVQPEPVSEWIPK